MAKKTKYRNVVRAPKTQDAKPHFFRFMASSMTCSMLDQLLAWFLFASLRRFMGGAEFLRILVANVFARCVSLSLNYTLNRRLVFSFNVDDPKWQASSRRESFPRFVALSAIVLALSTLGVFAAHELFGVEEWQAKIVVDVALFFLNYNVQRKWVFRNDVSVRL